MTSEQIKQVREAADIVLGRFGCYRADYRDCAKFVFSLVGTDGEEPVTEDWLVENYGFVRDEEEDCWLINFNDYTYEMHKVGIDRWRLCWDDFESWPINITTRYQFCQLAAALVYRRGGVMTTQEIRSLMLRGVSARKRLIPTSRVIRIVRIVIGFIKRKRKGEWTKS